ncbi:hypothetical protein ABT063_31245 [Streptomyces sp. NPDC002838]|uniref:hypothetical protein n=1 Tax=Streptomyces sp. NPDC002838 TaxID=3154436 RepID=UPI003316E6D6
MASPQVRPELALQDQPPELAVLLRDRRHHLPRGERLAGLRREAGRGQVGALGWIPQAEPR